MTSDYEMVRGTHLHILDPISISIIITLVTNSIIICILLARVGCGNAVVLFKEQMAHSQYTFVSEPYHKQTVPFTQASPAHKTQ